MRDWEARADGSELRGEDFVEVVHPLWREAEQHLTGVCRCH